MQPINLYNADELPSQKVKRQLNQLSKTFKPKNVRFFFAPHMEFSKEEANESALSAINVIKKFAESKI